MLARLPRLPAALLLAVVLALLGWAASLSNSVASERSVTHERAGKPYGDVYLYRDIANEMLAGHGYYESATDQQRANHFPTRPFLAVRLPTLAWIETTLGFGAVRVILPLLLLSAIALFVSALDDVGALGEKIGVAFGVLFGGALAGCKLCGTSHELWAGLLLASAVPLAARGRWQGALVFAALALAIRELALPFVLLAAAWALWDGWRREALAWLAVALGFALALTVHAHFAALAAHPGDAVSPGWLGLRGPAAPLSDLARNSLLGQLPDPWSGLIAVLPLIGWIGAPWRLARYGLPMVLGYLLMIAVFARSDTTYWAIILLPLYCAGFAFVPRTLRDLVSAALGRPRDHVRARALP